MHVKRPCSEVSAISNHISIQYLILPPQCRQVCQNDEYRRGQRHETDAS